jgi:hypothetical protein
MCATTFLYFDSASADTVPIKQPNAARSIAHERVPFNPELTRHELGKETKSPILCSNPRKLGAKGVAHL